VRLQFGALASCEANQNHAGIRSTCIGNTVVTVAGDARSKSFKITATDPNADRAGAVATALSKRLIAETEAAALDEYNSEYSNLDGYRAQLLKSEKTLFAQLAAATLANSPNQGQLQAQHDAVVRLLGDTQQRLLRLENAKPASQQLTVFQR